ncbi:MAG: hypothetical protein WDZ40_02715 [Candidatus Spechtbacterales bacterium]
MGTMNEKEKNAVEGLEAALEQLNTQGIGSKADPVPAPKKARATGDARREALKRAGEAQKRDERGDNGRQSRDERFGAVAVAVAKAALAHRQEDEGGKAEANAKAKAELEKLGIAEVENPFTNGDFKGLVGYIQEAILDPINKVDGERIPLGSLRALQNVVKVPTDEANGAMHAFTKQRYDTTGLLLKAQAMIADAHNGSERSIRFSPGGLDWATHQLRRVAGELAGGEGFDAQRRVAGYESLADKVQGLREKVFGSAEDTDES